jgi:tetratricopeptide (TPR) repeat protein
MKESNGRESLRRKEGAFMNTKRIAAKGCFLLVIMLVMTPFSGAEDIILKDLYLKDGSVTRCDSVWEGLGGFVWCNQGRNVKGYPESDVDLKKTFEIQIRVAELVNRSKCLFEDGDWDGTIRAATAALDLDPENEVAYTNRAGAHANKGFYKEAISDCNKAVNINPYYSLAYNNRGYAMERAGHLPQALEDYDLSCRMGNELACENLKRLKSSMQ